MSQRKEIRILLSSTAVVAWENGKWAGQTRVADLYHELILRGFSPNNQATPAKVEEAIVAIAEHHEEFKQLRDFRPDTCDLQTCSHPNHEGLNEPFLPGTVVLVRKNREVGGFFQMTHRDGSPLRVGQFLVDSKGTLSCLCLVCKREMDREAKSIGDPLRWRTFESAQAVLRAIARKNEGGKFLSRFSNVCDRNRNSTIITPKTTARDRALLHQQQA